MSFFVTKSSPPVLVTPSEPTPAGEIRLTSTDKSRMFVPFTSIHVFERPIHEPAQTIRRSLSQALVHYYPIAGRVAVGAKGDKKEDVFLACTGEGVTFVSATADCTLTDARFLHTPLVIPLSELALRYGGRCGLSDPLLLMQVTEFTCGGYVVAVTWNHGITDAFGLAQFLQAVGKIARQLPSSSVVPVRYDDSFPDIPQVVSAIRRKRPLITMSKQVDLAYCDFTIPRSFINRVKEEFRNRHAAGGARPCTSFEVATAAIWQCRTRAINAAHGVPSPLMFTANVRKFVGVKESYYGNCVFAQLVDATSSQVANGAIVDLVRLIMDAKERIPDALLKGYEDLELDDALVVGLDCVDFGGGRPARVVANMEKLRRPVCFPCLPCSRNSDDGANMVAFCITEDHIHKFLAELARLQ
ncbi:hypothetical protein QOZ80_4AG0325690 [Eleusine coracana subsp. coracana]|nr:hypothetical protein QOZ80_4AG0325690 [Eleusine coracana subsp. coracana]